MSSQISFPAQLSSVKRFAQQQFDEVIRIIIKQRLEGASKIDLPAHAHVYLQKYELNEVHRICEQATSTVFHLTFLSNGDCSFTAIAPMSSATNIDIATPASSPDTISACSTKKSAAKVPRPRNAFLIYRGAHHDIVKTQHPGIHNNDISKVIGRNWARESQAVKDEYKRQADQEKRDHAIAHPGYQYQPRKPSEKKKRMTKRKLAKLATADEAKFPASQHQPVIVGTFVSPYENSTSQVAHVEGNSVATFDVVTGDAGDDGLRNELALLNYNYPQPDVFTDHGLPAPVFVTTYLTDGEIAYSTLDRDSFDFDASDIPTEWNLNAATNGEKAYDPDPYAEQRRQEQLDKDLDSLVDLDGGAGATGRGNFTAEEMAWLFGDNA